MEYKAKKRETEELLANANIGYDEEEYMSSGDDQEEGEEQQKHYERRDALDELVSGLAEKR